MADSHKTEQATPRRIDKARREGNFPQSRDLVAAAQWTGFALLAAWYSADWCAAMVALFRAAAREAFLDRADWRAMLPAWGALVWPLAAPLARSGAILVGLALAAQLASTGMGLATSKLAPRLDRLDPVRRLRQLPEQALGQLGQAAAILPLVAYVAWRLVESRLPAILLLPLQPLGGAVGSASGMVGSLVLDLALAVGAWGLFDLWRQRARWSKQMRMSKQEVRDEAKETEGNPQIKQRIRRLQRSLLRRRMVSEVERATAVVVNPTHFAVAIRYRQGDGGAPRVVAKGKNHLALRIRERAIRREIPIVENPPLAQALYRSVEVGQEIPPHLYRAVAEVLAYLFRLMGGAPAAA
jgi:flagellar biosynthetic protein FlhB